MDMGPPPHDTILDPGMKFAEYFLINLNANYITRFEQNNFSKSYSMCALFHLRNILKLVYGFLLTLLKPMEFSIKFDKTKSGFSIIYINSWGTEARKC